MTHPATETLSDFLDGDLPPAEQSLIESHVAACEQCGRQMQEFRRVVARARALEDRAPATDLWPGVAAAIGAVSPRARRFTFSLPELLAAGIALVLLSGGTMALLLHPGRVDPEASGTVRSSVVTAAARADGRGYDAAVRELEAALAAGQRQLDSTTVRVVEQKLALIDRAIGEAERALATDPSSNYLNGHLAEIRLRKLDLLRRAAALTRAVS